MACSENEVIGQALCKGKIRRTKINSCAVRFDPLMSSHIRWYGIGCLTMFTRAMDFGCWWRLVEVLMAVLQLFTWRHCNLCAARRSGVGLFATLARKQSPDPVTGAMKDPAGVETFT